MGPENSHVAEWFPSIITSTLTFTLIRGKWRLMIFFNKENILFSYLKYPIDLFENIFLQVKWVLIDLGNFITEKEFTLKLWYLWKYKLRKLIILARVVRVTFDGRVTFYVLPQSQWLSQLVAMSISLEVSSQTFWWYSVSTTQPMGQLKVKFGRFCHYAFGYHST